MYKAAHTRIWKFKFSCGLSQYFNTLIESFESFDSKFLSRFSCDLKSVLAGVMTDSILLLMVLVRDVETKISNSII